MEIGKFELSIADFLRDKKPKIKTFCSGLIFGLKQSGQKKCLAKCSNMNIQLIFFGNLHTYTD